MEICTVCWCCTSSCDCGDEAIHAYAEHCENCGSISTEEELTDGYCDEGDCQEAHEEYRNGVCASLISHLPRMED